MAYKIVTELCTGCAACEPECPNAAISKRKGLYVIKPELCTECVGHFDEAQCEAVCPVDDTCIIDPDFPRYSAI